MASCAAPIDQRITAACACPHEIGPLQYQSTPKKKCIVSAQPTKMSKHAIPRYSFANYMYVPIQESVPPALTLPSRLRRQNYNPYKTTADGSERDDRVKKIHPPIPVNPRPHGVRTLIRAATDSKRGSSAFVPGGERGERRGGNG